MSRARKEKGPPFRGNRRALLFLRRDRIAGERAERRAKLADGRSRGLARARESSRPSLLLARPRRRAWRVDADRRLVAGGPAMVKAQTFAVG